jgi:fructose-1,6-bisphosphatase/inositol monophosphatase family enzyme
MGNFDYEVLVTEKPDGVSTDEAAELLSAEYPDHHIIVEEQGNEFVATLARKRKSQLSE